MAGIFQTDAALIPDDAQLGGVPGWDSLGHITFMMAIEAEWNVALTAEAMQNSLTLPAVEDFLAGALQAKEHRTTP